MKKCDECEGTGRVDCKECDDGLIECPTCMSDNLECDECEGTAEVDCNGCNGSGEVE